MDVADGLAAMAQQPELTQPHRPVSHSVASAQLADFIKRDAPQLDRPLVAVSDLPLVCWLAVAATTALVLPRKGAFAVGRLAARVGAALPVHAPLKTRMHRALRLNDREIADLVQEQIQYKFDNAIAFFRDRWHGDGRVVHLEGTEHLRRAQAGGRGAVIWMADMAAASDAAQLGLFKAGFPLAHMTRPEHGFSMSRFGMAWLNPFKRAHERKFLARHIMYDRANPGTALDAMAQTLKGGGLLSVLATTYEGRTLAEADFLGGRVQVAAGPPRLALDAGCEILPVFVIADERDPGHYRCVVEPPLATKSADRKLAAREAAGDFLARLEAVVRAHPAAWRGWADLHYTN